MLHSRRLNEFTLQQKTQIFYKQLNKNVENLLKLNITYINYHLQYILNSQNINNCPLCPYCLQFYLFPGEQVAKELLNKYNITINQSINLFSTTIIRPAECDHINPFCNGGTNNPDNGIFVCSRCNKQKLSLSTINFFNEFLQFNFYTQKYEYHPNIKFYYIELMECDDYINQCMNCKKPSKYHICWHCAGKKNQIISIANYNDTNT